LSWLITAVYVGYVALSNIWIHTRIDVFESMTMPLYAFSLFLPTIINDLGFSASKAQLYADF